MGKGLETPALPVCELQNISPCFNPKVNLNLGVNLGCLCYFCGDPRDRGAGSGAAGARWELCLPQKCSRPSPAGPDGSDPSCGI